MGLEFKQINVISRMCFENVLSLKDGRLYPVCLFTPYAKRDPEKFKIVCKKAFKFVVTKLYLLRVLDMLPFWGTDNVQKYFLKTDHLYKKKIIQLNSRGKRVKEILFITKLLKYEIPEGRDE